MVQVIQAEYADHKALGGGAPLVQIHHVARDIHGNGVAIRVYGEMKIAGGECVLAKELKLNTIEVLTLTPEVPQGADRTSGGKMVQKYIWNKGEYDNYASIDIYASDGTWQDAAAGSTWLNFIALGE